MPPEPSVKSEPYAVLTVAGLRARRGADQALAGVDLKVQRGEVHALTGPNGGGKSTLVAAICGGVEFTGEVQLRLHRPGSIGVVPQKLRPDASLPMTASEFLGLSLTWRPAWLGRSSRVRDRIRDALAKVRLDTRAATPLAGLSGGELQRLLLARATLADPELLLLDEPGRGLDEPGREVLTEILSENRAHRGVLVVTHDAAWMRTYSDRVSILNRVIEHSGVPEEVLGPA